MPKILLLLFQCEVCKDFKTQERVPMGDVEEVEEKRTCRQSISLSSMPEKPMHKLHVVFRKLISHGNSNMRGEEKEEVGAKRYHCQLYPLSWH